MIHQKDLFIGVIIIVCDEFYISLPLKCVAFN